MWWAPRSQTSVKMSFFVFFVFFTSFNSVFSDSAVMCTPREQASTVWCTPRNFLRHFGFLTLWCDVMVWCAVDAHREAFYKFEYLGEIEKNSKNQNHENNSGKKSRNTLPLYFKGTDYKKCSLFSNRFDSWVTVVPSCYISSLSCLQVLLLVR